MKTWFKLYILILICFSEASAISNCNDCLTTTVKVNMTIPGYQKIAREKAIKNLSQKLYSEVSGESILNTQHLRKNNNEYLKKDYFESIKIKYNSPIIGVQEVSSSEGEIYILTMILDYRKVGPVYANITSSLVEKINDKYLEIKVIKNDYIKKNELLKLKKMFNKYELLRRISFTMNSSVSNRPIVRLQEIELLIKISDHDIFLEKPVRHDGYTINKKGLR